jgi:formate-dependent nitrite reductase membrane component NrfD
MVYLSAEHFVRAPEWLWYILFYFFFAGLSGGSYVIATLLRLSGDPRDEPASRIGYLAALPMLIICPILLTADLAASWMRFWHMLIDVTPGETSPIFHYWSPMSTGAWALLVFGVFAFVSAVDAWLGRARGGFLLPAIVGRVIGIVGSLFGLFIASYTGVLLSVSNQPVWSDTWTLGGLFLASGLSGAAALIALVIRGQPAASFSLGRLHQADGYFGVLELALILVFFVTLALAGTLDRELLWLPLWAIAIAGVAASLVAARGRMRVRGGGDTATVAGIHVDTLVVGVLVLLGVLAMRAAVIFSAQ